MFFDPPSEIRNPKLLGANLAEGRGHERRVDFALHDRHAGRVQDDEALHPGTDLFVPCRGGEQVGQRQLLPQVFGEIVGRHDGVDPGDLLGFEVLEFLGEAGRGAGPIATASPCR